MLRAVSVLTVSAGVLGALATGSVCRAEESMMAAAVDRAAGRLVREQSTEGVLAGGWPDEEMQTGAMIAGLTSAFELVCDEDLRTAAEAAGVYVMMAAGGNYFGDEAYALSCLSRISVDRDEDPWRTALGDFYHTVETVAAGGTRGYVSQFEQAELSQAVFYLAHHVAAAFYVNASEKELWRQGLVDFLIQVDDDSADLPVLAVATATWALATTGSLDDSLLDPCDVGAGYWQGRTFAGLPDMLLSHQVTQGDLAGSFYWRLDHGDMGTGAPAAGYVEETVFGAMGLAAANASLDDAETWDRILLARDLLTAGVNEEGVVGQHLSLGGSTGYVYAAEVLRGLAGLTNGSNLDLVGVVDGVDLALWAGQWGQSGRLDGCRRRRTDLDGNGVVDARDLAVMASHWLDP